MASSAAVAKSLWMLPLCLALLLLIHQVQHSSAEEEEEEEYEEEEDEDEEEEEEDDEHVYPYAPDDPRANKLSFHPPNLTEEERDSIFTPKALECDTCMAVVYQMAKAFEAVHNTGEYPKGWRMNEIDVIDVLDGVCNYHVFKDYGVAQNDEGVTRIKGPGVFAEPGVAQLGGRTPIRLNEMCGMLAGELEEFNIYNAWYENGRTVKGLRTYVCEEQRSYCVGSPYKDEL